MIRTVFLQVGNTKPKEAKYVEHRILRLHNNLLTGKIKF